MTDRGSVRKPILSMSSCLWKGQSLTRINGEWVREIAQKNLAKISERRA